MSTHLTGCELAERLAVSPKSLANWRYLGRGPRFLKDGGVIRYRLGAIEAYERAHLVEAGDSDRGPGPLSRLYQAGAVRARRLRRVQAHT